MGYKPGTAEQGTPLPLCDAAQEGNGPVSACGEMERACFGPWESAKAKWM